jgi:glyoxalase family protein
LLADPEGQRLALVEDAGLPVIATGWDRVVPAEQSTRGFLGVDLESARPDATHRVLTEVLGFQSAKGGDAPVYEVRGEDTFGEVRLVPPTANRLGSVGAGGVHHVAFRVPNDESLLEMLEKIDSAGFRTSGYVDRFWFHSIYFREPGGILFELATDGPGFDVDESRETLGEKIVLPRFLEDRRNAIEADLKPLPAPVYLR